MSFLFCIPGKSDQESRSAWPLTEGNFERILQLCAGKDLIDCGSFGFEVDNVPEMATKSHYKTAQVSRRCVRVDKVADEVDRLRASGCDVRFANVETMKLDRTFDVVVATDLVEHLSNAGAFLERHWQDYQSHPLVMLRTRIGPNPAAAAHFIDISKRMDGGTL